MGCCLRTGGRGEGGQGGGGEKVEGQAQGCSPGCVRLPGLLQRVLVRRSRYHARLHDPGHSPSSARRHLDRRLSRIEREDARLSKLLLHMARGIFEEQTNLEKLVQKIMLDAQGLLKCEKCCVYLLEDTCERDVPRFTHAFLSRLGTYSRNTLVLSLQGLNIRVSGPLATVRTDPTSSQAAVPKPVTTASESSKPRTPEEVVFSKAFDLCAKDGTVTVPNAQVLAASKTAYIAKFVVTTGEPVIVADADEDGRFGKGPFEDGDGNRIRSVLCMPIHNSDKHIIGVTQLLNKVNGEPFSDNDVNIIEAFSIFTGLGIHNCQMYENACQLMAKQSVALEVLSFHATAQTEEASSLATCAIPSAGDLRLYTFDFDDMAMDDDGTLKATVRMFMEADIINTFKVPYEVICRWLCTVKKNYRPVTYHNWRHAFNVCQTMFTMLFTGELRPVFEDLEVFTLLAACLCHDLDHRGTNNAFQVKVASPLAMLYSTSVLEHHHFDHCIMILNSEGNNIFQSLSPEEYRRAIKLLEHAILSTDLALYFKKRGDFKTLVESGEKAFAGQRNRDLLRAMMMTACDVAAITKPWEIQKEVAQLVTAEFFEQGDIERTQLGEQPIPMMDRDKKDELPKMQVGFIDAICAPIYKLFADITEKLGPLYSGCENNRLKWKELDEQRQAAVVPPPTETAKGKPAERKEGGNEAVADKQGHDNQQTSNAVSDGNSHTNNSVAQENAAASRGDHRDESENREPPVDAPASNASPTTTSAPQHQRAPSLSPQRDPPVVHSDPETGQRTTDSTQPAADLDPKDSLDPPPRNAKSLSPTPTPPNTPNDGTHGTHSSNTQGNAVHSQPETTAKQMDALSPPDNGHRLQQQNGSTAPKESARTSRSDQHDHITEHPNEPSQIRGKRKTHAQAHAHAADDKKSTKKSGVCLVS